MTLLFGPITPPYNGQSVAFTQFVKSTNSNQIFLFNTTLYKNKYLNTLRPFIVLPYIFFFKRFSTVYFVGSRSKVGFIKEIPLFLLAMLFKKKLVNHLHGADFNHFYANSGTLKPLVKYAYNYVSLTIILLKEMQQEFKEFPKMGLKVIPNAYTSDFETLQPKFPKSLTLLYLSNLMRSKGIIEFLDASEILLNESIDLKINIAGQFLSDHLNSHQETKDLFFKKFNTLKNSFPSRIYYHGIVKGHGKMELLLNSAVFVLPTYYPTEAFPISIIEAMKTGNAIVTTDHNYLSHIITKKNGFLIEPQSSDSIVKTVTQLLADQNNLLKIQKHNINKAYRDYNHKQYIKKLKKILAL